MTKHRQISWGIIGSSFVTEQFCRQLVRVPHATIRVVCSRRKEAVEKTGRAFNVDRTTTKLSDVLTDDQVDAVYISSPTHLHIEHTLASLAAGKAVLCEKPIATSTADIKKIIKSSKENNAFCMEGMWMRFNPLVQQLKSLLQDECIGEMKAVHIEIGYRKDLDKLDRRERGALWNFSVYGISLLQYLFGEPLGSPKVLSGIDGIRMSFAVQMKWKNAPLTTMVAAADATLQNEAVFTGTKGSLTLASPFICPSRLYSSFPVFGGSRIASRINVALGLIGVGKQLETPFMRVCDDQSGFYNEAVEVHKALNDNKIESEIMPLRDSLEVARIAEEIENGSHPNEAM